MLIIVPRSYGHSYLVLSFLSVYIDIFIFIQLRDTRKHTQWVTKIKINQCSYRQLLDLPNIGRKLAAAIIYRREQKGNLTEEEFTRIPYLRVTPELIAQIDFEEQDVDTLDDDRTNDQEEIFNIVQELDEESIRQQEHDDEYDELDDKSGDAQDDLERKVTTKLPMKDMLQNVTELISEKESSRPPHEKVSPPKTAIETDLIGAVGLGTIPRLGLDTITGLEGCTRVLVCLLWGRMILRGFVINIPEDRDLSHRWSIGKLPDSP